MQRVEFAHSNGLLDFRGQVFAPKIAKIREEEGRIECTHPTDSGLALLSLHSHSNGFFAFLGFMQELPGGSRNDATGPAILGSLKEDIVASMAEMSRIASETSQSLKAIMLEVRPSDQEDPEDYYLARVMAAGMPPLLLVEASNYRMPIRSGIPLGISPDLDQPSQSLEWDRGSAIHFHTELPGSTRLEELHKSLVSFDGKEEQEAIHVRIQA